MLDNSKLKYYDILSGSEVFKLLQDSKLNDTLSHAYMIVCPDYEVVSELFKLIGCLIFCENGMCGQCPACIKVLEEVHSDIMIIDKPKVLVEDIEKIVKDTTVLALERGSKLYFVQNADKMNPTAQNKLLKTLEEPPTGVKIFLGVGSETAMLDTIKSRCKKLYLKSFSDEAIYKYLIGKGYNEEESLQAVVCSVGRIGAAESFAKDSYYSELFITIVAMLAELQSSKEIVKYINLDIFKKENIAKTIEIMAILVNKLIRYKVGLDKYLSKIEGMDRLARGYTLAMLSGIEQVLIESTKKLSYNVGALSVAESLLFNSLEVKYRCK